MFNYIVMFYSCSFLLKLQKLQSPVTPIFALFILLVHFQQAWDFLGLDLTCEHGLAYPY